MTVIAYRDGVMAADSLVTSDNGRTREGTFMKIRKLQRFNDWHVVGAAGSLSDCIKFYRWFEGSPEELEGVEAVSVNCRTGVMWGWDDGLEPLPIKAPFMAAGSGAPLALAAMYAGASAEEAVRAAMKVDNTLGGPVRIMGID
jgi:ATP-dependent protease HslVU (ClpYQ) peptidase subunit